MNNEEDDLSTHDITRPVVTIKRGKAPEVQEVDFACRSQQEPRLSSDGKEEKQFEEEYAPMKRVKKHKSMTTKSTMTNEDDYATVPTTTPCTTPTGSSLGHNVLDGGANDEIEVAHKIVGWKITPRVHFPPPNTLNASSLQTSEARSRKLPQSDSREFTAIIDPPYIHRPDRTLIVHQTKPKPLKPIKAWPGYGGNIYFQPFQINTKSIENRTIYNRSPGPRTNSLSGSRLDRSQADNDIYSLSKFSSYYRSSPSLRSSKKTRLFSAKDQSCYESIGFSNEHSRNERRQMARLDKNYILGLESNGKITEDLSWISGMNSLGTLKLGDPHCDVKRHSTNETYSRNTIVEKVPRSFVFHPSTRADGRENDVQTKIDQKVKSLAIRKYLKSYGIPDWALKQFVEKFYRDDRGRLRFPIIPLRVKGQKACVLDPNH